MDKAKDILLKFAKELGYKYIEPICEQEELKDYYVCLSESMKQHPNGKFGTPCVIAIDNISGKPYRLNREQLVEMNKHIND